MEEKYNLIKKELLKSKSNNPIEIVINIMNFDFINMHGPEHHFLDSGALLAAYKNSGMELDLDKALDALAKRTILMPGGMCGAWGVCGAAACMGAALSVINRVSSLNDTVEYKYNMELTSLIINKMSKIGGPRCCKRNAFISLSTAVDYINKKMNSNMEIKFIKCSFSDRNTHCIKNRCPYYGGDK